MTSPTRKEMRLDSNRTGQERRIADIWLALRLTTTVLMQITLAAACLMLATSLLLAGSISFEFFMLGIPIVWTISSYFVLKVWSNYHDGIVVDAHSATIHFPATDVENRLVDILTFKRFLAHGRREFIRLASIESIMNETRARRDHYAVNISGYFGSRQFVFYSKQKRDEFRAALNWGMRQVGVSARQDGNSDTGAYGG